MSARAKNRWPAAAGHTPRVRSDEFVCSSCRTVTLRSVAADASGRAPFLSLVCPACDDALTVEEHAEESDGACPCRTCEEARAQAETRSRARFAASCGYLPNPDLFGDDLFAAEED